MKVSVSTMFYVLVHFPQIDYTEINQIRKNYDPSYRVIDPHITLMFPVPHKIGEKNLIQHLNPIFKSIKPFPIHIKGFIKSWDHWLFLTLQNGNADIIRLYQKIYTGILARYKRPDIPFIPQLGLGLFVKKGAKYNLLDPHIVTFDQKKYNKALKEAETLNLEFQSKLDKLHLLKLQDNLSKIVWCKVFILTNDIAEFT